MSVDPHHRWYTDHGSGHPKPPQSSAPAHSERVPLHSVNPQPSPGLAQRSSQVAPGMQVTAQRLLSLQSTVQFEPGSQSTRQLSASWHLTSQRAPVLQMLSQPTSSHSCTQ